MDHMSRFNLPPTPRKYNVGGKCKRVTFQDSYYQQPNCDDRLDALLADLQNTISPPLPAPSERETPNYNSLNGSVSRGDYATINLSKSDKTNPRVTSLSPKSPSSPVYQNELSSLVNRNYNSTKPNSKISSTFNNNLSELDSLLEDLSSSKYTNRKSRYHMTNPHHSKKMIISLR